MDRQRQADKTIMHDTEGQLYQSRQEGKGQTGGERTRRRGLPRITILVCLPTSGNDLTGRSVVKTTMRPSFLSFLLRTDSFAPQGVPKQLQQVTNDIPRWTWKQFLSNENSFERHNFANIYKIYVFLKWEILKDRFCVFVCDFIRWSPLIFVK